VAPGHIRFADLPVASLTFVDVLRLQRRNNFKDTEKKNNKKDKHTPVRIH